MQCVHQGGGELARIVVGVHQAPVPLAAQKHVEQLLDPEAGAQTHQRAPNEKHEVREIVVVEGI